MNGASASACGSRSDGSPPSRSAWMSLSVRNASNQVWKWRSIVAGSPEDRAIASRIAAKRPHLLERLDEELRQEERVLAGQLLERGVDASAAIARRPSRTRSQAARCAKTAGW